MTRLRVDSNWRLTATAAFASGCATLLLSPTVRTAEWLNESWLLIALIAIVGGLCRQFRLPRPLIPLLQLLTATTVITGIFASSQAIAGLVPGTAAWRELERLVGDGASVVWQQPAPVPATEGVSLLVVAGVALMAISVDALGVTLRQAGFAGIPILVVYLVPAAVIPEGVPWPLFALSAIGWVSLLLVESTDRLTRWGRSLATRHQISLGGRTQPMAAGTATGRRLGGIAIIVAVALPLALPLLSGGILGNGNGANGEGSGGNNVLQQVVTINPLVGLRRDLRRGPDTPVFSYTTTATAPSYWQLATLDQFDGSSWVPATTAALESQQVSDGLPAPPGLNPAFARTTVVSKVSVTRLNQRRLPVPYPATTIDISGDWRYNPRTLDVFSPTDNTLGSSYQVTSLDIAPNRDQLIQAAPPDPSLVSDLQVPTDVRAILSPLVAKVTRGDITDYDKAVSIQNWFRSNFTYSLQSRPGTSLAALQSFLVDRSGYCEQFAATMGLMARIAGIPSRVVVGFTPGTAVPGQPGTWVVTSHDAHAWPQLWFAGVGWVRFEPTPGGGDGSVAPGWAPPPIDLGNGQRPGTQDARNPGVPQTRQLPSLTDNQRGGRRGALGPLPQPLPTATAGSHWLWFAGVGAVLALTLSLIPLTERRLIRRRRAQATGSAAVEAAWAELRDSMTDLDVGPRPTETPRDVAVRLGQRSELGADEHAAISRLAQAVERNRYAPAPGADPGPAWQDGQAITQALFASASTRTKRRAIWWPASSRQRLAAQSGRLGQRVEQSGATLRSRWRRD